MGLTTGYLQRGAFPLWLTSPTFLTKMDRDKKCIRLKNQSPVDPRPEVTDEVARGPVTPVQSLRLRVSRRPIHSSWLFRSDKPALGTNQSTKGRVTTWEQLNDEHQWD